MKAPALFNSEGLFSFDSLLRISDYDLKRAKQDRNWLIENNSPKWLLSEIYGHLKKKGELPELAEERKKEIWKEANGDKLLAFSLYLIEVV